MPTNDLQGWMSEAKFNPDDINQIKSEYKEIPKIRWPELAKSKIDKIAEPFETAMKIELLVPSTITMEDSQRIYLALIDLEKLGLKVKTTVLGNVGSMAKFQL